MKKYNKKVLGSQTIFLDNREIMALVTKEKEYYNIHVIDPKFKDDESNTLKLQEPVDCVTLEQVTSKEFLFAQIFEHFIWDKTYTGEGFYSVSVNLEHNEV